MTANIIPCQFDYGRIARSSRVLPKIMDNRPNITRMASTPWKIDQMLRQTKPDLEKGAAHAILTLPNEPIWGICDELLLQEKGSNLPIFRRREARYRASNVIAKEAYNLKNR